MKILQILLLNSLVLLASQAQAHGGHGSSEGLLHYVTEPLHLIGLVAVVAGVVGLFAVLLRLRRQHR
jgi:hypothetical protein